MPARTGAELLRDVRGEAQLALGVERAGFDGAMSISRLAAVLSGIFPPPVHAVQHAVLFFGQYAVLAALVAELGVFAASSLHKRLS